MKLYELLENNAETSLENIEISAITDDTRKVTEGCIFVCVKGGSFDGHTAAAEMLEKGAAAVVCEHDLGLGNRQIITENSRKLYGQMCSAWFGHPERKLRMIGVTGTNGKTTITNVIKYVLMKNGHKTGLVGTIQNEIGDEVLHTENTTPLTFEFAGLLDKMVKAGCEFVVMEVSSFGLCQNRIGSSYFETAVFTNLTQDHLDYHKTMEEYYQAKNPWNGNRDAKTTNNTRGRNKLEVYMSYATDFERHSVSATAGYSYDTVNYFYTSAATNGATTDIIHTLNAGPALLEATSSKEGEVGIGYFGRINYDYAKKYQRDFLTILSSLHYFIYNC